MSWRKIFQFINAAEVKTDENKKLVLEATQNSLSDMAINAGIMAGLGFFSTFMGLMASGIGGEPINCCFASSLSAGFQFFTSMAVQKGLKK